MNIQTLPLEQIKPAEKNVRIHGKGQIAELARSIEQFGQIRPIVTDENLVIIAGHGLYEALTEMGETEAQVLKIVGLSEARKKKLMLADNKVFELGYTDNEGVMDLLEEIYASGEDLDIPGYDMAILENILGEMEDIDDTILEYGQLNPEEVRVIERENEKREEIEQAPPKKEIELNPDIVQVKVGTPNEPPRPFVICPNCGEQIWL